nr:PREDICTED: uncharacterized protein K02A2.6-like [Tribolium castaneum]|eukprot:XP_015833782.1 PREDICTED: uncharacterized protein K02A2.6-like [Tribolium castaneum]
MYILDKLSIQLNCIFPYKGTLLTFGNMKLNTTGKVTLECKYKDNVKRLEFVVADVKSQPILGLAGCISLNLIKRIDQINKNYCTVNDVIDEYRNVFIGVGVLDTAHHIEIDKDIIPVVHPPRRIPLSLQPKLEETLKELERQGIIEKVEYPTDWVNSLVIVEKKTGQLRLCLDPKDLNKAIKREHYMIPTAQDIIPRLAGKKIFTVIDMSAGFWHVPLDKESSDLCCFNTHVGRYKFLRMPFGIKSAPEVFQKHVIRIFGHISGVSVIFDDLIIVANNEKGHDEILQRVLNTALENNIKFNKDKIQYKIKSVRYMGNIITDKGIKPDDDKVCAIREMSEPKCKEEVKRFLGMINFLSSFIPNVAIINAPLRELLKQNVEWHWTHRHTEVFNKLKELLSKQPTMKYFDPKENIVIQTDASKKGIGCCLLQNGQPVAYASRALTETEINYAQIEKELLAVVYCLEKFHYYIYGRHVTVQTDHKPLLAITRKNIGQTTARLQRMLLRTLKYDFHLEFIQGKHMYLADTLSRNFLKDRVKDDEDLESVVHSISKHIAVTKEKKEKIKEAMNTDKSMLELLNYCKNGWPKRKTQVPETIKFYWNIRDELSTDDGLIFKGNRLVIPQTFREDILSQIYEGHQGIEKCKIRARSTVYWPGISKQIENMVMRCWICEKYRHQNQKESLIPHPVPDCAWKKIAADIMTFRGMDFLIVIDYFSNWLEIIRLQGKTAAHLTIKFKEIFSRYGIPEELVSDNMPFDSYVI